MIYNYLGIVNNKNLRLVQHPGQNEVLNQEKVPWLPWLQTHPKDIDRTNGHLEKCGDDEVKITL